MLLAEWNLDSMGVDADTLHAIALRNLARKCSPFRRLAPGVVGLLDRGAWSYLHAAQVLLPERMEELAAILHSDTVHVALPSPRVLLACGEAPEALRALRIATIVMIRADVNALTPRLLRWERGTWTGWVPRLRPRRAGRETWQVRWPEAAFFSATRHVPRRASGRRRAAGGPPALQSSAGSAGRPAGEAESGGAGGPEAHGGALARYRALLRAMGLSPRQGESGHLAFEWEGLLYLLMVSEADEGFLQVALPALWRTSDDIGEEDAVRVLQAALQVTAQTKVAKVFPVGGGQVWATAELFCPAPTVLQSVLPRCLAALRTAAVSFQRAMAPEA